MLVSMRCLLLVFFGALWAGCGGGDDDDGGDADADVDSDGDGDGDGDGDSDTDADSDADGDADADSDGDADAFGAYELELTDDCEGIVGLNGAALLALQAGSITTTLGYIDIETALQERPTALSISLEWPEDPQSWCYPAYSEEGYANAEPRVAIGGLVMQFETDDGGFAETMPAKAWFQSIEGGAEFAMAFAMGLQTLDDVAGTWEPPPDVQPALANMQFSARLIGEASDGGTGLVGLTATDLAHLSAFVSRGGFAMATWPYAE